MNYKPFYGEQTFDFCTSPKKPFNVICADNGGGKTTTLDMIAWCLYGHEIHKPEPMGRLLNDKKREELKKGETAEVSVEMVLGKDEEEMDRIFSRKITFCKDNQGIVQPMPNTEKIIIKTRDQRDNMTISEFSKLEVNWVFPEEIQHLFMFDGEKLQSFFDGDNSNKTRQAIMNITQIEFLELAIKHLSAVSREYVSNEEGNPIIEQCESYIKGCQSKIEELELELKKNDLSYYEAKEKFDKIIKDLEGIGNRNLSDLMEDEKKFTKQKEDKSERLSDLERERFEHLLKFVPTLFCRKAFVNANKIIDDKYESGELPPNVKVEFLENLLNKKKRCICGTSLEVGSTARKLVEAFKEKAPLSKYEESIRNGQSQIKLLLRQAENFNGERKRLFNEIAEIKNDLDIINSSLSDVKNKMGKIPSEKIKSLNSQKEFYMGEMKRYSEKKGEISNQIEDYKREKARNEDRLRIEQKKSIKNAESKIKFDICDKSIKVLEEIKENLLNDVRNDIEKKTNNLFFETIDEPIAEKIIIDENFRLDVFDKEGNERYNSLSAGQKEILAISFMCALRQESGFNSPVLMDYLFGRISGKNRLILVDDLKKLSVDIQMIFFFIDTEFTSEVRNQMKDKLGSYIEIKKVPNEKRSEVIQK